MRLSGSQCHISLFIFFQQKLILSSFINNFKQIQQNLIKFWQIGCGFAWPTVPNRLWFWLVAHCTTSNSSKFQHAWSHLAKMSHLLSLSAHWVSAGCRHNLLCKLRTRSCSKPLLGCRPSSTAMATRCPDLSLGELNELLCFSPGLTSIAVFVIPLLGSEPSSLAATWCPDLSRLESITL